MFDPVTLIFVAIFVFVALRLRSVLGTRTGEEQNQYGDKFEKPADQPVENGDETDEDAGDNVVTLPNRGKATQRINEMVEERRDREIKKFADPDSATGKAIASMMSHDENFDPSEFIKGAKMAYEMIVTSFADGDLPTLKNLLSTDVYEGFEGAIEERQANGDRMESSFVGVEKADYVELSTEQDEARITVRFVSQLISTTRNSDGDVIDGDPEEVAEVKDVWTFARPLSSKNPNWKLVATESE